MVVAIVIVVLLVCAIAISLCRASSLSDDWAMIVEMYLFAKREGFLDQEEKEKLVVDSLIMQGLLPDDGWEMYRSFKAFNRETL